MSGRRRCHLARAPTDRSAARRRRRWGADARPTARSADWPRSPRPTRWGHGRALPVPRQQTAPASTTSARARQSAARCEPDRPPCGTPHGRCGESFRPRAGATLSPLHSTRRRTASPAPRTRRSPGLPPRAPSPRRRPVPGRGTAPHRRPNTPWPLACPRPSPQPPAPACATSCTWRATTRPASCATGPVRSRGPGHSARRWRESTRRSAGSPFPRGRADWRRWDCTPGSRTATIHRARHPAANAAGREASSG